MNILPTIKLNSAKQVNETVESSGTTRRLLRLLRALQPVSRIDLTRHLGVNRSTVTDICKPLMNAGIIREEPFSEASRNRLQGRPPIGLTYVDTADYFIGVNIGVRRSQVGMSTLSGDIVEEIDFITSPFVILKTFMFSLNVIEPMTILSSFILNLTSKDGFSYSFKLLVMANFFFSKLYK